MIADWLTGAELELAGSPVGTLSEEEPDEGSGVSRALYALGRFCVRHRYPVLVAWIALMVATAAIANAVGKQTSNNLTLPGTGLDPGPGPALRQPARTRRTGPTRSSWRPPHGTLDSGAEREGGQGDHQVARARRRT